MVVICFVTFIICRQDIPSLPGVSRWGVNSVLEFLRPNVENGLSSVLLFGVPEKVDKMGDGGAGETDDNPVMEAVRRIKKEFPNLTVACDVCLCPYTSHGHCGVLNDGMCRFIGFKLLGEPRNVNIYYPRKKPAPAALWS